MPLSDHQIAALLREIQAWEERKAKVERALTKRKQAIIKEMERRGTKALEHSGMRVTYVQNENVAYDMPVLERRLPKTVFKRIVRPVIDKGALEYEVQSGNVDPEVVADCSEVKYSKPYIRISTVRE